MNSPTVNRLRQLELRKKAAASSSVLCQENDPKMKNKKKREKRVSKLLQIK